MPEITVTKQMALLEEFETSEKLIKLGLGEIQNINLLNNFHFLPFQLISQGFERFMKAYICICYLQKHGALPPYKYLKDFGHDLEKLLLEITSEFFPNYDRPQFYNDLEFITENADFKELLHIISEFGKLARYYNFDVITDNSKIGLNTKARWEKFEASLLSENDHIKLQNFDLDHEVYESISSHIVETFERFVSGLARQFIFNHKNQLGSQITATSFFEFGLLYEGDFGISDYRKHTLRYNSRPFKSHKRTFVDWIRRNFKSSYCSKTILKSEFKGDWPFYSDKVTVECRYKRWCIVSINGYDFSLNGAASGRYKLENPHDAGQAILGKSTSEFIQIAMKLGE